MYPNAISRRCASFLLLLALACTNVVKAQSIEAALAQLQRVYPSFSDAGSAAARRSALSSVASSDELLEFRGSNVLGTLGDDFLAAKKPSFALSTTSPLIRQKLNVDPANLLKLEAAGDAAVAKATGKLGSGTKLSTAWKSLKRFTPNIYELLIYLAIDLATGGTTCLSTNGQCGGCRAVSVGIVSANQAYNRAGPNLLYLATGCNYGKTCELFTDYIPSTGIGAGKIGSSPYTTATGVECSTVYQVLTLDGTMTDCFVEIKMNNPFWEGAVKDAQFSAEITGSQCTNNLKAEFGPSSAATSAYAGLFVYYDIEFAYWDTTSLQAELDSNFQASDFFGDSNDDPFKGSGLSLGGYGPAAAPGQSPASQEASSASASSAATTSSHSKKILALQIFASLLTIVFLCA
jgi:hypothetical protein